jgi:signal transduction histidine kinase
LAQRIKRNVKTSDAVLGHFRLHPGGNRPATQTSGLRLRELFQGLPANCVAAEANSSFRAQENERKRIGRELHDEMGQRLMTLRFYLGMLAKNADDTPLKSKAEEALAVLDDTIDGLRRIISRLMPRDLEHLGLVGAIRKEAKALSKRTEMKSHLAFPRELGRLDYEIELAVYRVVQEALNNISKHSGARNFGVALERSDATLTLRVDDDGRGFSSKAVGSAGKFGMMGMSDRIKELGGTLRIRSQKGGGAVMRIEIPVARAGPRSREHVPTLATATKAS